MSYCAAVNGPAGGTHEEGNVYGFFTGTNSKGNLVLTFKDYPQVATGQWLDANRLSLSVPASTSPSMLGEPAFLGARFTASRVKSDADAIRLCHQLFDPVP